MPVALHAGSAETVSRGEMARLMALVAQGKAVDTRASDVMLAVLKRQQDRAMIPRLLPSMRGLAVGNKTGTDEEKHAGPDGVRRHVRADPAIVSGPGVSCVMAICARQVEDTRWSVDNDALTTGARISRLIFDRASRPRLSARPFSSRFRAGQVALNA